MGAKKKKPTNPSVEAPTTQGQQGTQTVARSSEPVGLAALYRPHQCGCLRRPECDYPKMEAWEKPSGELHIHDPRSGMLLLTYPPI